MCLLGGAPWVAVKAMLVGVRTPVGCPALCSLQTQQLGLEVLYKQDVPKAVPRQLQLARQATRWLLLQTRRAPDVMLVCGCCRS
jgi:hypothetical protein